MVEVTIKGQVVLSRFGDFKGKSGPLIDGLNLSLEDCGIGG